MSTLICNWFLGSHETELYSWWLIDRDSLFTHILMEQKRQLCCPFTKINRPALFFVAYRISNCTKNESSNSSTKMLAIFLLQPPSMNTGHLILSSPRHLYLFAQVTMQPAALLPVVENDRGKKHPSWSHHDTTGSRRANDFVPGSAWHFWTSVPDGLGFHTMSGS